jgi:hypothetical protein
MPGPGVPVQGIEVFDETTPQRIEVNVPNQLEKVGLLLHHNGLVPALDQGADAVVVTVERADIACQQPPHGGGEAMFQPVTRRISRAADQEMKMVWQQRPGKHNQSRPFADRGEALDEVVPVTVIAEQGASLQPPDHHVLEDARRIQARAPRHVAKDSRRQQPGQE